MLNIAFTNIATISTKDFIIILSSYIPINISLIGGIIHATVHTKIITTIVITKFFIRFNVHGCF